MSCTHTQYTTHIHILLSEKYATTMMMLGGGCSSFRSMLLRLMERHANASQETEWISETKWNCKVGKHVNWKSLFDLISLLGISTCDVQNRYILLNVSSLCPATFIVCNVRTWKCMLCARSISISISCTPTVRIPNYNNNNICVIWVFEANMTRALESRLRYIMKIRGCLWM